MRALRRLFAAFLALSTFPASAGDTGLDAAAIATAERLREQALAGNAAWDFVAGLTTEIGPRLAGTEADARAVAWTKARFEAMGFDRVYLEPVTFPVWLRHRESAAVLAPFPQPLVVTALGGSVGTDGPLEAEIVEFATLDALKAAPEGSLRGKIAFISNRMQRFRDGRGYGPAVGARSNGAVEAARKGAVAVLIRSIGTSNDRFAHTGAMRYVADVPRIPAGALSNPDADQLVRMIEAGHTVRLRLDISAETVGQYTSHNVIAEVTGRELPQEVVTIGGHLDSWDQGTGAIDDGAGVAITAAAGALIASLEQRPRRTVRVIAYANEEQGLYGGKAYAEARAAEGAVPLHQLGAESDFGAGRIYALRAGVDDAAWPVIERIGQVLAPLGITTERGVGGPGPDVGPIVAKGAPWAQLAQDGTDYFDYHHTPNDTLDKIEPAALDQQVAAYAVLAWLAAETTVDFGSAPAKAAE
ncbi:M28 family peptidase [Arenimonas fontis]|uniref:Carboxypeptidase Q n=1 Tax=Arenimonas fontis TaxID=2608255 RepID=A0A5B2ZDJ9_9GAMM|nr:M28 family peptidase [Arenimonas fontis]KAA2285290.1 M28 family peptidase [Arenimonas fontis]